jgi:hypothetical protein
MRPAVSRCNVSPWLRAIVTLALMLAAEPWARAAESGTPIGHYYLQGMREVGSELILGPDGRFQYMLAYGAYDEFATGTWKVEGRKVSLNSEGKDIPPTFTLKSSESHPDKSISVQVVDKNGRGLAGIDVIVDVGSATALSGYTQTYGLQLELKENVVPRAIGLGIRMYNLQPQWVKIADNRHNHFVFQFDPGDLGQVKFHDTALEWDNDTLIMERNGKRMRYVKQ